MRLLRRMLAWWRDPIRRREARARQEVQRLFLDRPEVLRGTSLRPEHRGRVQVLEVEEAPLRVTFGILRHPRPYAFSSQHHEVLELWSWEPQAARLRRLRGHNLTRAKGEDDAPRAF